FRPPCEGNSRLLGLIWMIRGSCWSFGGLHSSPGPGADAFSGGGCLLGPEQSRLDLGRGIQGRIVDDTSADERARGGIVVAVVNLVGDLRNHLRAQHEIDELICSLRMRRTLRNEHRREILIGPLPRYR